MRARRQASEAVESELWQFCLRVPAAYDVDDDLAALNLDDNVRARLTPLAADLPAGGLDAVIPTEAMLVLRAGNVRDRHDGYLIDRLGAIVHDVGSNSRAAEVRTIAAQAVIYAFLFATAVAAIGRASRLLDLNLVGLFFALVGAITAWLQFSGLPASEASAKIRHAFFLNATSQAQRFSQDNDAWFDVVRRIEARAAPSEPL
jgi:hypothetical protein